MLQQCNGEKRPVWFVFSGMGTQWAGMAKDLMQLEVFEKGIRKCAGALEPEGVNLYDIILSTDESTFDNVMNSFISIAAIQVNYTYNMVNFLKCFHT
jgi:fatty acid synthase